MADYTHVLALSLTSHEAHNRLLVELQTFYDRRSQLKMSKVLLALWPTLLNSGFLLIAILHIAVLLPYLFDSLFDFVHLLIQLIVTFSWVVLNIALELNEIQIKSLWHIKRCMSHSDNFMGQTPCPWESSSYPSQPITTLRSQITIRGLRDRTLVNIPCSLLVKGDILQLHSNTPSPANVKGIGPGSSRTLKIGETSNSRSPSFQGNLRKTKTILQEDEYSWYIVTKTPIIQLLQKSLDSSPPSTLLYQQYKLIYKIVTCLFVPVVYGISFILTLSRWAIFRDYTSWHSFVLSPTYIAMLLLAPSMQLMWRIMNCYGIVLYDDMLRSSPLPSPSGLLNRLTSSAHVFVKLFKALFSPYMYPLPDHVHSMGSITAICAVDKEFLLTGGMPKPEKVFFFRSNKQGEFETTSSEVITTHTDDSLSDQGHIEFECCDSPVNSSSTITPLNTSKNPFYSIEITPEILGLSLNLDHSTGLSFDDPNWLFHVNSLKPIALNVFATSHLSNQFSIHCNSVSSFALQHYLYKTQCSCPLAYEIGVSEYPYDNFNELQMMYLIRDHNHMDYHYADTFPRNRSNSLLQNLWNDFVQPHCISMLIEDRCAQQKLLMTRGSADIIVDCCLDFWDGKYLQPFTETEKQAILDFFARKTISAYCVALAYSPVSDSEYAKIPSSERKSVGVYLSSNQTAQNLSSLDNGGEVASNVVRLLSSQVFLGMISLQYQPKQDIIQLVQSLQQSGIRFIHYTAENEVRGKLFAEKLGLEAGWNCHISLQADKKEEKNMEDDINTDKEVEDNISTASSDSSVSSIYYNNYSYIKAKLPKGVGQVRSHIETVDNVPLLVPLFTDCTPEAVTEMIKIMQENGEVVLCMGNAWVRENISILAQANIGMSFTPSLMDMGTGDCAIVSDGTMRGTYHPHHQDWPTPLEAASSLNSLTSGAYLARDADVNLVSIVHQCRHTLGCLRRGLLFFLASLISVVLFCLLCGVLFQPIPLSGSHVYWYVLVIIPLLSLSLLPISVDSDIIMQLPDRKNIVINIEWKYYVLYFTGTYVPMLLVCVAVYWLSLNGLCGSIEYSTCDVFLGNTNSTNLSLGWQGNNAIGYLLAQNISVTFLTIYLVCSTTLYIHHFKPIWKSFKFITWQYIAILVLVLVIQIIFFTFSQILMDQFKSPDQVSFGLYDIPVSVWVIGCLWVIPQGCIQEIVKYHNRKLFMQTQTRLKLSFETKLGMHSPV